MAEDILLKVNHIEVFHGKLHALWDVSLAVKRGEIVALIGANMSGKTTLLDTISGFLHPFKGEIEFEGEVISALAPYKIVGLGICHVPEGRRIFPDMDVLENLIVGSYRHKARPETGNNLARVYDLFPILEERKRQYAKTLSGGEQQMLVIGRGLMSNPKMMLLDEMSLGLAPLIVNELYSVLKEIRRRDVTVLFVEQNVRRTLAEADRAYITESGRVMMNGDVADLREEEIVKKAYFGI